jgi:ATP-dependent Lhr-like helicase
VFVLNGRCVRLVKTELLVAKVVEVRNVLPTVPRWNANKMPLASGLAAEVVRLRTAVAARLPAPGTADADAPGAAAWLKENYGLSAGNIGAILRHFRLQAEVSAIPTGDFFLIERHEDGDLLHYFFHSLIGRSANDALSRLVAQRLQQAKGGNALVTIDDYGFMFSLRDFQDLDLGGWQQLFKPEGAEEALRAALEEASLVKWQFRVAAQTGLMVPRRVHGKDRGSRAIQWSAEIIFNVLRQYEPDHPLLAEAYAEATLRFLDLPRATEFMRQVASHPWQLRKVARVSPFSFGMYVTKIKETMTLEDPEMTIERLYHEMYGPLVEPPAESRPKVRTARPAKVSA